jgi:fumarate hydratase, class II
MTMSATRREKDSFGFIEVPAERLWGAQTQRSLEHFAISDERMPLDLIVALAVVKRAGALANRALGLLLPDKANAIMVAAEEVIGGRHDAEFPLGVWQTGSGTQTNMNLNEVLANRASQLLGGVAGEGRSVHPNDDVNLGQSSNDVFPTAMHLAAGLGIVQTVLPALERLRASLQEKAAAFAHLLKIGRTHLQDATPMTLGQEFSGYVAQLDHAASSLHANLPSLYPLAIGGTAVGTGLNTHAEFGGRVAAEIARYSGLPFVSAANKFAALASHDGMVAAHGSLKLLAVALMKIANDIRWLASGPRSGLGEIAIPENEPGSSIMPGKVNPTQCEALTMACCQILANDVAISIGGASGNFELNVYKPLIAHNFLQSVRLLADAMTCFEAYCVRGIVANHERLAELMERSLMLVTALVPQLGYDKAAEIARHAAHGGTTLKQAALALGYTTAEEFDAWVVPATMTGTLLHSTAGSIPDPKGETH